MHETPLSRLASRALSGAALLAPRFRPMKTLSRALLAALVATSALAQGPVSTQTQIQRFKFVPPTLQRGGEIRWRTAEGGRQEFEKGEYVILENDVVVEYQNIKLHADKVTVNLKTKDTVAEGHVILDQGPQRVTASHAVFNLDTKTGTFFDATAAMEPTMYFTGEKIEKTGDRSYRLTEGVLTSCDLENPAWSFHLGQADITVDDYAHMKNVALRARRLPIVWLPRLVWPTKHDRAQGFLIPRLVFSTSKVGSRIELGYFMPFGDSADVTGFLDVTTEGYNGVGADIRYLPSDDVKIGELNAYTVRDPELRKQQWKYQYRHAQENLPAGFRGVVDIQDYSDLDFFRRFDRDPRLHTLSNIYSSAYLTKNRSTYSINVLADRRDIVLGHVIPNDPRSPVLKQRFEQLPSLQLRMYPHRVLESPFYFALESSASHLRTTGVISGPDANYYRTDLFPTVSMQLRTPPWLSIKPQVSVRGTHYSASLDPATAENPFAKKTSIDEALERFYAQAQVELVGPSVSRVYNEQIGGFTKFKHLIEPRFRYIYTTDVANQNRVIRFDTVDTPFLPIVQDSVEYSLTQRIIGRESDPNASPRELLSFSLRQTAALSKPFTNATGGNAPGSSNLNSGDHKFTPLIASLHVNPYQSITFDASTSFSNVSHQIDQTSVSANLVGTGSNVDKYFGFTWFATFNQPNQMSSESSQVRLNTGSSILRDRLRTDVSFNYDAKTRRFLEERFLVGGNGSCWGLAVGARRYLTFGSIDCNRPDGLCYNLSYEFAVTLKNVGTIGTH